MAPFALPHAAWRIDRFLKALASKQPVPGGGAAAALAGAMGAALGEMTARVLLNRKKKVPPAAARVARQTARQFDRLRRRFEAAVRADAKAYADWAVSAQRSGTVSLPGRQAGGRLKRRAIEIPMGICEDAVEGAVWLRKLKPFAGPHLSADIEAGLALFRGAFLAADAMVQVNLKG
ncbi:MAG: hypothetical protein COV76_07620 [Candidatus Omnitrophica bacterium CG11_big_fil_rev_8_21_14_0_20_64_10]|nr:MAG: hypothetical protein COV76_07620 [Candidatus Omnitrophica bacterium CG11_big_fil_rev_8_21_14_0_20_64_10]